jgi:hypothetical protein
VVVGAWLDVEGHMRTASKRADGPFTRKRLMRQRRTFAVRIDRSIHIGLIASTSASNEPSEVLCGG